MNIVLSLNQYCHNNVFFCDPIKNNIMNEGNFIRIIYSNEMVSLNGIYLQLQFNEVTCEKYYHKYKCIFNINNNKEMIEQLKMIEEQLLQKYKPEINKVPSYKIYEQVKCGFIKLFSDVGNQPVCHFILKISGIWETQSCYGLTYKFIPM